MRSGSPKVQAARRKRTRKLTKGFRASRHNLFRMAIVSLIRSRVYSFRDRKAKKRQYRRMWIVRVNAACRMRDIRYSEFIHGLQLSFISLDRKSLSEIAINDPATFDKLVEIAKKAVAAAKKPEAAK